MRLGDFDRRVVIQQPSAARNSTGGPAPAWSEWGKAWMKLVTESLGEVHEGEAPLAQKVSLWEMPYRTGLSTKFRLSHKGNTYQILEISEVDRGTVLQLKTEKLS